MIEIKPNVVCTFKDEDKIVIGFDTIDKLSSPLVDDVGVFGDGSKCSLCVVLSKGMAKYLVNDLLHEMEGMR